MVSLAKYLPGSLRAFVADGIEEGGFVGTEVIVIAEGISQHSWLRDTGKDILRSASTHLYNGLE